MSKHSEGDGALFLGGAIFTSSRGDPSTFIIFEGVESNLGIFTFHFIFRVGHDEID